MDKYLYLMKIDQILNILNILNSLFKYNLQYSLKNFEKKQLDFRKYIALKKNLKIKKK